MEQGRAWGAALLGGPARIKEDAELERSPEEITQERMEAVAVLDLGPMAALAEDVKLHVRQVGEQVIARLQGGDLVLPPVHEENGMGDPPQGRVRTTSWSRIGCRGRGNMASKERRTLGSIADAKRISAMVSMFPPTALSSYANQWKSCARVRGEGSS